MHIQSNSFAFHMQTVFIAEVLPRQVTALDRLLQISFCLTSIAILAARSNPSPKRSGPKRAANCATRFPKMFEIMARQRCHLQ